LFLAGLAQTDELKQMVYDLKTGFQGQPLFQSAEVIAGKVNNPAAVGTDQVMVGPGGTNRVAAAATPGM